MLVLCHTLALGGSVRAANKVFAELRLTIAALAFASGGGFLGMGLAPAARGAIPLLYVDDASNNIGTVNLTNNAVTVLGNAGSEGTLFDIGFASNGNLYGLDGGGGFYSINTTTGAATHIGDTGLDGLNALVGGANGSLWAAGDDDENLYNLNSTNGASTSVGTVGFSSAGDLAFVNGTLYEAALDPDGGSNNILVKITLSPTVTGTEVGSFGVPNVYGLASDNNGVLYALSGTEVYTVNLSTAALTPLLNYAGSGLGDANGEAFADESGGATPTPPGPTGVPLPPALWSTVSMLGALGLCKFLKDRVVAPRA
jgi:hypothetical protein